MEQGDLWRGIEPHRSECGADPAADVQVGGIDAVQPFRIRRAKVSQADSHSGQA